MTVITLPYTPAPQPHIRRFIVNRDLQSVADLIEMCFASTLDYDGRQYIRRMRASAHNARFLRWASTVADPDSLPMSGFVWEQEGQIIGNLSLIRRRTHKVYLIANVAVHPDFRRRGIARSMTAAAVEHIQKRKKDHQLWLHVRDDNEAAQELYQSMAFREHFRRTNWRIKGSGESTPEPSDIQLTSRRGQHWHQQEQWLNILHPPMLHWYIPLERKVLRPGILGILSRFLNNSYPTQWAALRNRKLIGVLSHVPSIASADRLWLATNQKYEIDAVHSLVSHARRRLTTSRSLDLEYPTGRAEEAFETAGFQKHQTLIWMKFDPTRSS